MRKKLVGTMLVLAFLICAAVIVYIVPGNKGNTSHVNRVIGFLPYIYRSAHVMVELLDDPAEEADGGQGAQSVQSVSMSDSSSSSGQQEYVLMTRERAFGKNTILLKGIISNIRDVAVTYTTSMDSKTTDEFAMFDVEVEEVLYCSTDSLPDSTTVSVGIPYTMREKAPGVPRLVEGAEYLVFCYATADIEKDPMEMAGYVDCWLSDPRQLLLQKEGETYIVSDFLQEELKSTAAHPDQIGSRIACDVLEAQLAAWMEEYHTQQ